MAKLTFSEVICVASVDLDCGFGSDEIMMASFRAMVSCKSCSGLECCYQKRCEGFLFLKITIASSFFPH